MTPTMRLLAWTGRAFGDDIAQHVFAPFIADWQRDRRAVSTRARRLARDLSGAAALLATVAQVAARLAVPWGLPRRDMRAIGATLLGFTAVGLAPFVLVPLVSGPLRLAFVGMLAPAMAGVALPVALLPTAATIERRSRAAWQTRAPWLLAGVTFLSSALLVAHVGWVVPAANQLFRVRAVTAFQNGSVDLPRGVKELTLPELVGDGTPAGTYPSVTAAARHQEAVLRVVLVTVWPAVFASFGWRLARYRGSRGALAVTGWWMLAVVTALLVSFGASLGPGRHQLPPVLAAAATWLIAAAALRRHASSAASRSRT